MIKKPRPNKPMIEKFRPGKPAVTVFGAGIAGLTAAHELVTRGFHVQVIDPDFDEEYDVNTLDRGVGGMARSQWAINLGEQLGTGTENMTRLWSGASLLYDVTIPFKGHKPIDEPRAMVVLDRLMAAYEALEAHGELANTISVLIPGRNRSVPFLKDPRVKYIVDTLTAKAFPAAMIKKISWTDFQGPSNLVTFFPGGETVPAEHGFRFFPSFYRHLFDTMRRTPISSPTDAQRTKATTFDNLVATDGLGFARAGKAVSFIVPRHKLSLEETRKLLNQVLEQLQYTGEDIARFSLKIFKYMSSSSARRAGEYETTSWGEFLESHKYSPVSRRHIEDGPQMSAALRGSQSDARTQGNITIQLLMDQLKPDSNADFTLSGPTSSYWLNHWHDFLRAQGVKFERGKLLGFHAKGDDIIPTVEPHVTLMGTHYVLALSLPAMAPLAANFLRAAAAAKVTEKLDDMRSVVSFAGDLRTLSKPTPSGPLQHLSGIQYYFDQDLRFWRGHTQYLDSAWGLTSISQPQFWSKVRDASDGYRSILSVDIGNFDRVYTPKPTDRRPAKRAWDCSPDEIAAYAWEQIVDHHDDAFRAAYGPDAKLPVPIAYSIDAMLLFRKKEKGVDSLIYNSAPFLVNKTGEYVGRPGKLNRAPGKSKTISCYDVILDKYVLAGTFMQTFTRLTSMEGANESARHAVNALLQVFEVPGDRCDIFDPEDNEIDDLQWLKDFDQELFERGLPHFVDILGWNELPDQLDLHHLAALTPSRLAKRRV